MITLTIAGTGIITHEALIITPGQKYLFEWADDIIDGPSAGTLAISNIWSPDTTGQPAIHKPDGTAATWNLASVNSGGIEFRCSHPGNFNVAITGGTVAKIVHFNLIPIPG